MTSVIIVLSILRIIDLYIIALRSNAPSSFPLLRLSLLGYSADIFILNLLIVT